MTDVVIVGGGLSGLACAHRLDQAGVAATVLEATDRLGGRVRTDVVEGYQLDHGFQVLACAYPACRQLLDYQALRLRYFEPAALVRCGGRSRLLGDPWRRPQHFLTTLRNPVGSLADKWRMGRLRLAARSVPLERLYQRPAEATADRLRKLGFSHSMTEHFFRPFLGGVFLDQELRTSSRMMELVLRIFAEGPIAVPADGMAAIPRQLAERLPRGSIHLQRTVESISSSGVRTSDGQSIGARVVVLATESTAADRLVSRMLAGSVGERKYAPLDRGWNRAVTMYFSADTAPDARRMLILRGDDASGPVNHVAVMTNVAPEYAPSGRVLVSVSLTNGVPWTADAPGDGLDTVRIQLRRWFGDAVDRWRHLRTYDIPYALPKQEPEHLDPVLRLVEPWGSDGPIVCGDHRETSSIQGALSSGMRAAEAVVRRLKG